MNSWSNPWLLAVLVPVLLALGALLYAGWESHRARRRRKIPKHWPLSTRSLTNSEEARVWHWLARAFYDHHIMIKLPVTRFTLPRNREQGMHWYRLLGGVYCTFTICKADGRVVGCLDVPGTGGIPRATRLLKHSLLTQIGLPYWVIKSGNLPSVAEIRAEFLGESITTQAMREREMEERAIIAAQANLRTAISRQRSSRQSDFSPLSNWSNSTTGVRSDYPSQWQEDNSFLMPLDSRKGDLL
ncbi:MAG: hypothetical protein EP308_00630 [Burkholderiales bacterium]|nr:MAG: hypothetical protein EP308_00630 [Burkholderiales bacterium]